MQPHHVSNSATTVRKEQFTMLHPHAPSGSPRRGLSVALTLWIALVATLGLLGSGSAAGASTAQGSSAATESGVEAAVASALALKSMPTKVTPSLDSFASGTAPFGNSLAAGCKGLTTSQSRVAISHCKFGDTSSNKVFMLVGDSKAQMWFDAIDGLAKTNHWKFYFLTKDGCPSAIGSFRAIGAVQTSAWPQCSAFNAFVLKEIRAIKPTFVVVSSEPSLLPRGQTSDASPATETADFLDYFKQIPPSVKLAVLGGLPTDAGLSTSLCLSRVPADIQTCTFSPTASANQQNAALQAAANGAGATFIDQSKWLCAGGKCPPVISNLIPYWDGFHLDVPYTKYLGGVLWSALTPVQ
jgi:SGNH domain (fused to AT3 domains)